MSSKTIPVSVRLPEEDAEYLAKLKIDGAATLSEKLRTLIGESRWRREGVGDYGSCLAMAQEMLGPAEHRVRETEHREGVHSELVLRLMEWLPEVMALLLTRTHAAADEDERAELATLEREVADRVFRLVEAVLRMGVTQAAPCYDRQVIRGRLAPVLEMADLIKSTLKQEEKQS